MSHSDQASGVDLNIKIISDVMCPWCAVGIHSLLVALEQLDPNITINIRFEPFELAPDMAEEGELIRPHLARKYGLSEAQVIENQKEITRRGAELGFVFNFNAESRKWNTRTTHRLLHWAAIQSQDAQRQLKLALLEAYFTDNRNPSSEEVLIELAQAAGLDPDKARQVVQSDQYAQEVLQSEQAWMSAGINSVPAFVLNDQYLVSGAQPPEQLLQSLEEVARAGA